MRYIKCNQRLLLPTFLMLALLILVPPVICNLHWFYKQLNNPPPKIAFIDSTSLDYTLGESDNWYAESIARDYVYYTAKELSVQLTVLDENPPNSQFYYVLLSCFDNNDIYNQIGIAANHGYWSIVFSWSTVTGPWWNRQINYKYIR